MKRVEITGPARRDLAAIFATSEDRFGREAADRYRRLVESALRDLREAPEHGTLRSAESLPADIRLYHLRHSNRRTAGARKVGRPRHVLVVRIETDKLVLLRVLHDAMDITRHVS